MELHVAVVLRLVVARLVVLLVVIVTVIDDLTMAGPVEMGVTGSGDGD